MTRANPGAALLRFWSTDRSLTAMVIVLILTLLLTMPMAEAGSRGSGVIHVMYSLLLVSGVMSVTRRRLPVICVTLFAVATFLLRWLAFALGGHLDVLAALATCVFCALLTAVVLAKVFAAGEVTLGRIQGSIAAYILLGLMWGAAYEAMALVSQDAFRFDTPGPIPDTALRARLVYFSFVTLTTVGYGDITALHPIARGFAMLEGLTGQLYPAILIGGLVSMATESRSSSRQRDREQ